MTAYPGKRIPHTPKPWSVDSNDAQQIIADCDGLLVAEIHDAAGDRTETEVDANRRLIAAAPELLAALESAIEGLLNPLSHPMAQEARLKKARAAIRKAK
jgi:hypothetical protein